MGQSQRPPTEAELEQQQRKAMGFYDSDQQRKEIIRIKSMSPDEIRQARAENEYRLLNLQSKYSDWADVVMDKLNSSDDPKTEFGRGAHTKLAQTVGKYLTESRRLDLEERKFDWAKTVWADRKNSESMDDLAQGIIVDIKVEKIEGECAAGGNIIATQGETP